MRRLPIRESPRGRWGRLRAKYNSLGKGRLMHGNGYGYGSTELLIGLLALVPILIGFFVLYLVVRGGRS